MKLGGVHHVSINVDDNDACRAFYLDVLGLRELERPDFGFAGTWLETADGTQIHLMETADHVAPKGQHYAFLVDDLDDAISGLADAGVKVGDPREIPGVCRQAFFKDPAGNAIELNQRLGV